MFIAVVVLAESANGLMKTLESDTSLNFIWIFQKATRAETSCGNKLGLGGDFKWSIIRNLTVAFLVGAMLFMVGILVLLRRFRLQMALITVVLSGGIGMLPVLLLPTITPTRTLVSITIDKSVTDSQIATLNEAMSPGYVLCLLPTELKSALPLFPMPGSIAFMSRRMMLAKNHTCTGRRSFPDAE